MVCAAGVAVVIAAQHVVPASAAEDVSFDLDVLPILALSLIHI